MTQSMTGFANLRGEKDGWRWVWDIRSVNGRGLDIRLRVPDWVEGLEPMLRETLRAAISRGSVTLSLRLQRDAASEHAVEVDADALDGVLAALKTIELQAKESHDMSLAPARAIDLLPMVRKTVAQDDGNEEKSQFLVEALKQDIGTLLTSFSASRQAEGARLAEVLGAQIDAIEKLAAAAEAEIGNRTEAAAKALRSNMARVLDATDAVDESRLAQELALIAVKSDIMEEVDRLKSHVAAARDLLAQNGPIGRKMDFLTQEFNREANTLCSKAQSKALTGIGLDLKAVIDQMREQVQNVE